MTNSGLIQIHRELEESAQVCGAGVGGILRRVLLPLLRPTMLYAWIWLALLTYRELTLPLILSTGDNMPLSVVVWSLWNGNRPNEAAALTVWMLCVMVPILFIYWTVIRRLRVVPTE
jgi:iron(III) transport system permease protein